MHTSVLIQNVSSEEFFEKIRLTVREEINLQQSRPVEENGKLCTRQETSDRLRISLPTLNTYTKNGIIKAVRIGYRVLYREEDVQSAMKSIPSRR